MSPLRRFSLSLTLAIVCVVTFAVSYYAIAEGKRTASQEGYGYFWLFGSLTLVALVSVVVFSALLDGIEKRQRTLFTLGGTLAVAGTYFYLLMFDILNTLGS